MKCQNIEALINTCVSSIKAILASKVENHVNLTFDKIIRFFNSSELNKFILLD